MLMSIVLSKILTLSRLYSIKIDKEKKLKELIILTDEYRKIG